jgi:ketopantoate reductase
MMVRRKPYYEAANSKVVATHAGSTNIKQPIVAAEETQTKRRLDLVVVTVK